MKFFRRLVAVLILFIIVTCSLIWLLSPVAVRMAAKKPLAEYGLTLSSDSKVRLNLFSSSVSVQNLMLLHNGHPVYSLDALVVEYSLRHLFRKEIYIQRLDLDGMALHAVNDAGVLSVAGVTLEQDVQTSVEEPQVPEPESDSAAGTPMAINVPAIHLQNLYFTFDNSGHEHELLIDTLNITDTRFSNGVLSTAFQLSAELDGIDISLDTSLQLDGQDIQSLVAVELANITAENFLYLLPESMAALSFHSNVHFSSDVHLSGNSLTVQDTDMSLDITDLNTQQQGVDVRLKDFSFALSGLSAQYQLDTLATRVQGDVAVQFSDFASAMTASEDLLISLGSFDSGTVVFELNDQNVAVQLDQLKVESLIASKVMSTEGIPALFVLDDIAVMGVTASNEAVSISSLELGGGSMAVILNSAGDLITAVDISTLLPDPAGTGAEIKSETEMSEAEVVETEVVEAEDDPVGSAESDIVAGDQVAAESPIAEPTEESVMEIQLGQLLLTSPIEIRVEDQSNSTPFAKVFEITKVDVKEIDSSQPELKTTFDIAMKDSEYFTLEADGWVQIFKPETNLSLITTAREFPMNEVAPYLKDSLGFEVKSGQLDADITANVVNNQLDSDVVLLMRGANFSASETPEDGSSLIGQTAIPLNVALNMLKDGNGNIELKIPVDGDINDPNFGLQYVVGLVVKKVVLAQAKNYLISTLVPYAKVVSVAVVAGEQALKVRFEDLIYIANQTELQAPQMEFAEQLAALMRDKPALTVNVCAIATPAESVARPTAENIDFVLDAQAISSERGLRFKNYLVSQYDISSARLLVCSPQVDAGAEAEPRIELKVL